MKEYGRIDVVAANAGVAEIPGFLDDRRVTPEGRPVVSRLLASPPAHWPSTSTQAPATNSLAPLCAPTQKPNMLTPDVNITGTAFTVRLGFFHLRKNPSPTGKSIFILGSMASYLAIPLGSLYSASKHAVMGLFRSLEHDARAANIALSLVCPWFCATTGILGPEVVFSLAGLPLTDQGKVVDAMLLASVTERCGDALTIDAEGILRVPGPAMCYDYTETNYYKSFEQRAVFVIK